MKRFFITLISFLLTISFAFGSDVNHFEVSSTIAQPVTIKTDIGDFSFRDHYTLYGHFSRLEAFDYHGNKIVNTQPYKREWSTDGTISWYRFSDIYENESDSSQNNIITSNRSRSSGSGGSSSSSYTPDYSDSGAEALLVIGAAAIGVGLYIAGARSTWDMNMSRLDLGVGAGNKYGPCIWGTSLTYRWPRIWGITGGLGFGKYSSSYSPKRKLNSYLGGQVWMYNGWNVELGLNYYDDNIGDKFYYDEYGNLHGHQQRFGWYAMTNTEFCLFGPVGFYGGVGATGRFSKSTKIIGLLDLGIIIRLSSR